MKFIIWRRYKWLFIGLIILILVILFLGILLYSFPVSLFQILLLVNKQSTCMNHYNHEHFLNLPFYSYRTTYPWKSWSRINWKMSRYWCSDRQWDTTNREPAEILFLCIFLYFYPPKILEYITYTKCYFCFFVDNTGLADYNDARSCTIFVWFPIPDYVYFLC